MKRVHVQRHPIDTKPYRVVTPKQNAELVAYFEERTPAEQRNFDWLATTGGNALASNSLFPPGTREIEMWTGARGVAHGRAAAFAAGTASARVKVPFGDRMVEVEPFPEFHALSYYWLQGWYCATLLRDAVCLELLAQVSDEIFRVSRVRSAPAQEPWRGALIAYHKGQDSTALVERACFLIEPAQRTALMPADAAKLWGALFRMMLPLFHRDAEAFNRALVNAVEEHKKFYRKRGEGQQEMAFLALGPAALCALAHDAGLPIEVDSEYLPRSLIEGMPPAESAGKPAAKTTAEPAAKSTAKQSAKKPATSTTKQLRGRH
jgi:hypothetical protein